MRHRTITHRFGRRNGPKKALMRGLVYSLVENERIKTTVTKAKETRRHFEKALTLAKTGNLASRRLLLSRYPQDEVVTKLVKDLGPRFKERPGGYTRIIKIGRRPGDDSEMVFLELVDFDPAKAVAKVQEKQLAGQPEEGTPDPVQEAAHAARKKKRKAQRKARRVFRLNRK